MMKTLVSVFLLNCISYIGFSQKQQVIDSLIQLLSVSQQDVAQVEILNQLSGEIHWTKPDSALYYAQRQLSLARKLKYLKGEGQALIELGFSHRILGNYTKALEIDLKALQFSRKHQFKRIEATSLLHIGLIYNIFKDYPNAISFIRHAIDIYHSSLNDSISREMFVVSQAQLGGVFFHMNQLDSALFYTQAAHKDNIRFNVGGNINSLVYMRLGSVYRKIGDSKRALEYLREGLKHAISLKNFSNSSSIYLEIAKVYQNINKIDSCILFANTSLELAQKMRAYSYIIDASRFLAELYKPIDLQKSNQFYTTAIAATDGLIDFGNMNTQKTLVDFDEKERQYEIETATKDYQNKIKLYILSIGLATLAFISFLVYRNYQKEKKGKLLLKNQKEEIENTLSQLKQTQAQLIQSEKLASLGELTAGIAHEIQNPLNFVNNFAEVSAEMLDEMEEELDKGDTQEAKTIATDLKLNLSKINHHGQRASSIVKGMLEHSRTSTGVKEPTDMNTLADEYLRLAYHGWRAKESGFNCQIETHFEPDLPSVEVIPQDIGRVLLNLINNAFYAVTERSRGAVNQRANAATNVETRHALSLQQQPQPSPTYQPTVTVSTQKIGDHIIITIQDNGKGIPEDIRDKIFQPFFTTKPTGQGTGLGLSLAYDIVTKGHGGALEVESKESVGTAFIIQLPI